MSWNPDLGAVLAQVPGPEAGADEIAEWAEGLARHPAVPSLPPRYLSDRFGWLRVSATAAFWCEEGAPSLAQAVTELLAGLWHGGAPVAVAATATAEGLALFVGAPIANAAALEPLLSVMLPGVQVEKVAAANAGMGSVLGRALDAGGDIRALIGKPAPTSDEPRPSIIERLARTGLTDWSLVSLAMPAPRDLLHERFVRLAHLRAALASRAVHHVVVDDVTTAQVGDPLVAHLLELVGEEQDRCRIALQQGGFVMVSMLRAHSALTLAALDAVAVGALGDVSRDARQRLRSIAVMPAAPLPAEFVLAGEAASVMLPPSRDLLGLPCRSWARFDEHPEPFVGRGRSLDLGTTASGARVSVPVGGLVTHALVTGNAGAGKSSLLFDLLDQLHALGVPYLVIEPTKSEYADAGLRDLQVWAVGSPACTSWRLNPLEVPDGTPVQNHVERLVALFRASFGMVDPLPYLLEEALHRVYELRGWDLASDTCAASAASGCVWPTLAELLDVAVVLPTELGYPAEVERTVAGAFRARLGSLLRGPKGAILNTDEPFDISAFLNRPTLVNLDLVGDDEVKAFFMGIILLRLAEARQGQHTPDLQHVTIIEEAHRLLARDRATSVRQSDTSSNASGHAAESIANLLAEIRASGEGVIVVDQSPSRLAPEAVANTAIKIALRSTERDDKVVLAGSMNLDDAQRDTLTALPRHQGAVWWEGMDRPVLVNLRRRYPLPATPANIPPRRSTGPLVHPSPRLAAAVRRLVRTPGARAATVRTRVEQLIAAELHSDDEGRVLSSLEALVARELESLGRARRWTRAERERAVWSVVAGADVPEHPARKLRDGRGPLAGCAAVCPAGGCLAGEAIADAAGRVRSHGFSVVHHYLADPEARRRRWRRELLATFGPDESDDPDELDRVATGCLSSVVFDELVDPDTIAGVVAQDRGRTRA